MSHQGCIGITRIRTDISEGQVQGGATGALIVEGLRRGGEPALAGLPERTFVLRDQLLPTLGS